MRDTEDQYDEQQLRRLILTLAGAGTTIEEYRNLCERLWRTPQHWAWLMLVLLHKLALEADDPDDSLTSFVADRVVVESGVGSQAANDIIESLPHAVLVIEPSPEDDPNTVWAAIVEQLREETGLALPVPTPVQIDSKTAELASLIKRAVAGPWTQDLDQEVDVWRKRQGYGWLEGLREARRAHTRLVEALAQADQLEEFDANEYARFIQSESAVRRRYLTLHDDRAHLTVWCEPKIDTDSRTVVWQFRPSISGGQINAFHLYCRNRPVGRLSVQRVADTSIRVVEADGLLLPLGVASAREIPLRQAAADVDETDAVEVYPGMSASVAASRDGFTLLIRWSPPSAED
ncbi:MAG: hypothetical protein IT445_18115 [Phycisphaeraceae bacterium]|nr:hypothetical protein [Phycisphaeraceae bacterium]